MTVSRPKTGVSGIRTPTNDLENHTVVLRQLKESVEVLLGVRGDPTNRSVTLGELAAAGVVRNVSGAVQPPGLYTVYEPTSLTATAVPSAINFSFGAPASVVAGVQYELLESASQNGLSSAAVVWTGAVQQFTLQKTDTTTRYYWIRTVLPTGQRSFAYPASSANPSAGGIAGTAGAAASFTGNLDNIPDGTVSAKVNKTATDGSGNIDVNSSGVKNANQKWTLSNNSQFANSIHVGTLVLGVAQSATLIWHAGNGYNTGSNQQAIATITIRAGNNTAAPNIAGASIFVNGGTSPIVLNSASPAVALFATNGSTSPSNDSWEVYFYAQNYSAGPLEVIVPADGTCSFSFSGVITGGFPSVPAAAQVNANGGFYINPNNGQGLDGMTEGSNYLRMPAPPSTSASASGGLLTQTGTGAQFTVSAMTYYLGNVTMSVNAGTVAPGSYNTFYVYFDSPNYAGGAVAFQVTTDPSVLGQYPWRFFVGTITCTPSGGGTGGGGGRMPCFTGNVRIKTPVGYRRFDELPEEFEIVNHTGRHRARLIVHPQSLEPMRRMGGGLVTVGHPIRVGDEWVPAGQIFHEAAPEIPRTVYNMHVMSDSPEDHHYLLENGLTAHNIKQ